ncbi:hypothetical protein [Nocardia nova]|uniref:hypothetical protein n=1 Tax=Nocardia nova TaxID=37330 RepID=UPI0015E47936|nr:hypothetical protein [Nocardia nova]
MPQYLDPVDLARAAASESVVRMVRGLFDGDRALHPGDAAVRAAYEDQVRAIAREPER